jgi:hypothetical protein
MGAWHALFGTNLRNLTAFYLDPAQVSEKGRLSRRQHQSLFLICPDQIAQHERR